MPHLHDEKDKTPLDSFEICNTHTGPSEGRQAVNLGGEKRWRKKKMQIQCLLIRVVGSAVLRLPCVALPVRGGVSTLRERSLPVSMQES